MTADPLLRWRAEFPIVETCTYLVSHSLGAMPRRTAGYLQEFADTWSRRGVRAWHEGWWEIGRTTGDLLAPVLGVSKGTISMHQNVTVAMGVIGSCHTFDGPRRKIVMTDLEFPSNMYLFEGFRRYRAEIVYVKSPDAMRTDLEALLDAITPRTKLVFVATPNNPTGTMTTRAELDAYFRAVIAAVSCDVHVSNNPLLTGYSLPLDLVAGLVGDHPHVRVVCVTERDTTELYAFVNLLADRVEVRIGVTRELRACQDLGARGLLSFEANVLPRLTADAWSDDDAYRRLVQLNAALARAGNPRSLKAVLDVGPLRDPYLPLTSAEADRLEEAVRALR